MSVILSDSCTSDSGRVAEEMIEVRRKDNEYCIDAWQHATLRQCFCGPPLAHTSACSPLAHTHLTCKGKNLDPYLRMLMCVQYPHLACFRGIRHTSADFPGFSQTMESVAAFEFLSASQ